MCRAGSQLLVAAVMLLSSTLAAQNDGHGKAGADQTARVKLGVYLPDTDNQLIYTHQGGYDEFTVTPERAQQVQFIRPYYYSAGAALYAPGGSIKGVQSWEDLRGKLLTIKIGYYAAEDIENTYGIRLLRVDTFEEAAHVIAAGEALALVDDSIIPHDAQGLFLVETPEPIFREPYGMAVALNNTSLAEELSRAMDRLIEGGQSSTLVQLEQEMLIDKGVPPNPDIATLVANPEGDTLLNPAVDDD